MSMAFLITALLNTTSESGQFYAPREAKMEIQTVRGVEIPRGQPRALSVRVTFPKAGGPYPVIVFSHGMYGSEDGMEPLVNTWAERGYVVIQPTHGDSLRYADAATRRAALQGSLNNVGDWRSRPQEIKFVLDNLGALETKVSGLKGKMDKKSIGMSGHSYGAWTTQMVAGMKLFAGRQEVSLGDPRPKAFVSLSPQGLGGSVTKESYASMRGPMLYVSGDLDRGRGNWDPKVYRRQAFDLSPKGGRIQVWIKDAYHNFGGITGQRGEAFLRRSPLAGPANPEHVKIVQNSTLAFWDAELKGRKEAKAFWSKSPFAGVSAVKVEKR